MALKSFEIIFDVMIQKKEKKYDSQSFFASFRPMFEEDVPSVLELEMEALDEWMKKDGRFHWMKKRIWKQKYCG